MEKKAWSEEEVRVLEHLISLGYTYREIARALERSPDSIKSLVRRRFGKRVKAIRKSQTSSQVPKGIVEKDHYQVLKALGITQENLPNQGNNPLPREGGHRKNSRGYLSDEEALRVISEYLKRTRNIHGATRLWELHLFYRRKRVRMEE